MGKFEIGDLLILGFVAALAIYIGVQSGWFEPRERVEEIRYTPDPQNPIPLEDTI